MALHQLTRCIRELGAALVERQGALTSALEGSRCRREEALSAQVSERRGLLEDAGLMVYTQELLKEADPPCFVQAARVTHNRFRSSSSFIQRPPPPRITSASLSRCRLVKAIGHLQCFSLSADPSFRHFHLDASKEVKLINSLEFIRGGW